MKTDEMKELMRVCNDENVSMVERKKAERRVMTALGSEMISIDENFLVNLILEDDSD